MSRWSNMFLIISEEPGEWRHKTIFCWTGAWQNLSTWLSFHLHRLSWRQQTMTSMHVVPQSRTQVQCDSPAPRTEQLRAPAAFSLSPSGFIPKEDTYASWMALHPHSTLSFFVFFPPLFLPKLSFHFVSLQQSHASSAPAAHFWATCHWPAVTQTLPFSTLPKLWCCFPQKHAHSSAVSPSDDVSGGLVKGFGWRLRMAKWLWEPPVIPLFGMGPTGAQWKM